MKECKGGAEESRIKDIKKEEKKGKTKRKSRGE